jgi:hypothetical protein
MPGRDGDRHNFNATSAAAGALDRLVCFYLAELGPWVRSAALLALAVPVGDFGKLKWPRFGILKWPRCLGCGVGRHLDLAHSPVAAKCGTLIWPHLVWVFLLAA